MHRLYLHIGTPKTGTTSIQNFCHDNIDILHGYGYDYPDLPYRYAKANKLRNGHFLAGYLHDEEGNRDYEKEDRRIKEAFANLKERFARYDHIILSDEGIWNRSLKEDCRIWQKVQEEVYKGNFEITVIVYLRPQYDYLYSWWNQRVKQGMCPEADLTWEEMLARDGVIELDYYNVLEQISKFVGKENIMVRIFDRKEFIGGSLYKDFVQCVGLPHREDYFLSKEQHNTSLTRNNGEIKRILNELPNLDAQGNIWFRNVLSSLSEYAPDKVSYCMLTPEEMQSFNERFRESNIRLEREYLGRQGTIFTADAKQRQVWKPEEDERIKSLIWFFGELNLQMKQQNQELQQQVSQIDRRLLQQEKRMERIWELCKNPIVTVGRRIKKNLVSDR